MRPLDLFLCFAALAGGIVLVALAFVLSWVLYLWVKGKVTK